MPKSNKKRKREQKVRSPPSSKDLQLDQKKSEAAVFRKGIDVDDTKREKHREKTTKKSADNCEKKQTSGKVDDKDSCNGEINTIEPATTLTSDGQQQQNEHTLDDSAKKKKKKKKKRKIRQVRSSSTVILSNSKSNGSYSGGDVDSHNGKIGDHNKEDEPVLEGSMVSDVLVLIDRKTGRVFSATEERLKNGERKQVGCLDGKGQVELFQKPEERENGEYILFYFPRMFSFVSMEFSIEFCIFLLVSNSVCVLMFHVWNLDGPINRRAGFLQQQ